MDPRKLQMLNENQLPFVKLIDESIKDYILAYDESEIIDEETIAKMASSLTMFCVKATEKFLAGQKKHGGKITDKDLDKEISQEVTDLFWYLEAKDWQMELYENECREETKETESSDS